MAPPADPPASAGRADPALDGTGVAGVDTSPPTSAAASVLEHLADVAMQLVHASGAQVSLTIGGQTTTAAAGAVHDLAAQVPRETLLAALQQGPVVVEGTAAGGRAADVLPALGEVAGAHLAVGLVTADGRVVGALSVSGPARRTWTQQDLQTVVQLAGFAMTALQPAAAPADDDARRLLWDLSIASAGVGSFDWDLTTGRLHWDQRLIEQFGYDLGGFDQTIEAFNARLHPDDLARVTETLTASVEGGAEFASEYRIVLPGGRTRWISAKGRPLRGRSGAVERLLGATLDITGTRAGEAAVAAVHEAMNAAFYALDRAWCFTYVNTEAERLLQRPRDELAGSSIWELFPAAAGSDFEEHYRGAVRTGELVTFEAHYPAPLDGWYEVRAVPTDEGLSVYFLDISSRRLAQDAARAGARRTALIAQVTATLAEHLDAERAVAELARLVVPDLGDWCLVSLVDDGAQDRGGRGARSGLRDVAGAHVDPAQQHLVDRYAQVRFRSLGPGAFVLQALASAEPVVVPGNATQAITAVLGAGEAVDLLTRLAPRSAVVFPLRARGRTLGLLTVFRGATRPPLTAQDYDTAVDVAGRSALALDNSRLYRQQRDLASGLQRSLLTAPPEPDHTHVVVRYVPAADTAQVGGDWYDAFLQPDGAMVLVIGDVVGHDTQAAAAMSQVRTLVRGLGAAGSTGPAALLSQVDRVMQTLRVDTTATAVVARLEQTDDHRACGLASLRWSNAGHPPPMVVHPDGSVTELAAPTTDLLLGVLPSTTRHEFEALLDRGATVLMYTDGLVERRGQSLEVGLRRLRTVLARLAAQDLHLDDLSDAVLAEMLPERADDDVALVAVRMHPQELAPVPDRR